MSARLSRRRLLWLAGGGAATATLATLPGCDGGSTPSPAPTGTRVRPGSASPSGGASAAWPQPPVIESENGRLDVTLRVEPNVIPFGQFQRWAVTVNGTSPGPTLRIRPGDLMRIRLENRLWASTNLHTHGLKVSPAGKADNPFIEIPAGSSFDYEIEVPKSQAPGLYWYHPHFHHHVAEQLFSGFYGAIIVERGDEVPEIVAADERLLLFHDTKEGTSRETVANATFMETREGREGPLVLVNGARMPILEATAGRLERWRILNASASRFYRLSLDGHDLHVIGTDDGRIDGPAAAKDIVIVPGERTEVLVQPSRAGDYGLRSLALSRGSMGAGMGGGGMAGTGGEVGLATVRVTGTGDPALLPRRVGALESLAGIAPVRTRELEFSMQGPGGFLIDGRVFDQARVDQSVALGSTEDWLIRNTSPMDHPFHLHVWPFQVIERSAGPAPVGWKDVVNVPAGGWVRIRIPFREISGKTVYHCHILDHEDLGMMGVVQAT